MPQVPAVRLAPVLMALLFGAPAFAEGFLSAPREAWVEGEVKLPAAPSESSLTEFFVSSASPNRFLIDRNTLRVDPDDVVRYVLVVRTPGGAENVTFEGIRCDAGARRIYASGRKGGEWAPLKNSEWVPISYNTYNRPRAALAIEVFCDGPVAPRGREEILRRLDGLYDPADFRQKDR
ncbi:CNP1-like family protein [Azoarcus sp. L1K30]|uniref:CNP1-like family protein n=1 Tax=Azoarcus sp. L1K30 TaxID=2820277 RepID=UPI001B82C40C|nr:CNP1-like family protein [Azoarcus sp. L1K30]MBR0568547.1 CNP1-like family protein [Azoarcus sp. L1K30]